MAIRRSLLFAAAIFAVLVFPVISFVHCLDLPAGSSPVQLVVAVDKTQSISANQSSWMGLVAPMAACIRPGDKVRVLVINANSGQTPAVVDQDLPSVPPGDPLAIRVAIFSRAREARRETQSQIGTLFSSPRRRSSDRYPLHPRPRPSASRR